MFDRKNICVFHTSDFITGCKALDDKCNCDGTNIKCSFYKTKKRYEEEVDNCIKRCRELGICRKDDRCRYGNICYLSNEVKGKNND